MTKKLQAVLDTMPQEGFAFDEANHVYAMDGKPLTGVTTILSVIAKPALIQWSADEAMKHLGWFNQKYDKGVDRYLEFVEHWAANIKGLNADQFFDLLTEGRLAHRRKKDKAADMGTKSHEWIETYVKARIGQGVLPMPEDDIKHITDNFVKWAEDNQVKFLESEKRVFSKEHWYAGTLDLVFEMNGKKYIGDLKTSSGIYGREYFFQMAGYQIALEEMGAKDFFASMVIRCGKDGSFETKESFDLDSDKAGFLAALNLYRELSKE